MAIFKIFRTLVPMLVLIGTNQNGMGNKEVNQPFRYLTGEEEPHNL